MTPRLATLSEIAISWLPVLGTFSPDPLAVPVDVVLRLAVLSEALEAHGKSLMAKKVTVLMLAAMPENLFKGLPDPPEKMDLFAAHMVHSLMDELKGFLE